MWIRVGGGNQPMWIIIKIYIIGIKSANVDKGGGGKMLIHEMWIKRRCCFFKPSLIASKTDKTAEHVIGE